MFFSIDDDIIQKAIKLLKKINAKC